MERDARFQNLLSWPAVSPAKETPPPPSSTNRAPIERDAPFPEPSFHYLLQFPVNGPPPQVPLRGETPVSRTFFSPSLIIHLSFRDPGKGAHPCSPQQGPYGEIYSISITSGLSIHLYLPESPQKWALIRTGAKHKVTVYGCGLVPQGDR